MEIVNGMAKAKIPDKVLKHSQPLWTNYVVGYFIDEAPTLGKIDAQFLNPKTGMFRIDDPAMRSRVLRRHFWHIGEIPLVVQEWSPKSTNLKPDLSSMPIWGYFTGVPDHLFSEVGLTFLGDIVGVSQKLHPNTIRCIRLDVARVLVIVNLEKPLLNSISLNDEEETLIKCSCPWLPSRCSTCNSWGHKDTECAQMKNRLVVMQDQSMVVKQNASQNGAESSSHRSILSKDQQSQSLLSPFRISPAKGTKMIETAESLETTKHDNGKEEERSVNKETENSVTET